MGGSYLLPLSFNKFIFISKGLIVFGKFLAIIGLVFSTSVMAAEIDVDSANHSLTFHDDYGITESYPIAVGRSGTNVRGDFVVSAKRRNPTWTPTPHMLKGRKPYTVPAGPHNPLGAAKLYLDGPQKYIGIHGTNDESSIGKNVSHGCFRLHRKDIIRLYNEVPIGTIVKVR